MKKYDELCKILTQSNQHILMQQKNLMPNLFLASEWSTITEGTILPKDDTPSQRDGGGSLPQFHKILII